LISLGIKPHSKIGIVDVGWTGSTQKAFVEALSNMLDVQVVGFYFSLANTPQCSSNRESFHMYSFLEEIIIDQELLATIYSDRVLIEYLFSAPKPSTLGYNVNNDGVEFLFDHRTRNALFPISQICNGEMKFIQDYQEKIIGTSYDFYFQDITPIIKDYLLSDNWKIQKDRLLTFFSSDDWAYTIKSKGV
jgi:hypothetical protein